MNPDAGLPVTDVSDRHVLSDAEYHAVVDAVRRWRTFAREMVTVFEQQGRRADPAYQGALHMVVLADQVLRILGRNEPADHFAKPS
jgi:hypothetical protein